jgi:hypothetical protein
MAKKQSMLIRQRRVLRRPGSHEPSISKFLTTTVWMPAAELAALEELEALT